MLVVLLGPCCCLLLACCCRVYLSWNHLVSLLLLDDGRSLKSRMEYVEDEVVVGGVVGVAGADIVVDFDLGVYYCGSGSQCYRNMKMSYLMSEIHHRPMSHSMKQVSVAVLPLWNSVVVAAAVVVVVAAVAAVVQIVDLLGTWAGH